MKWTDDLPADWEQAPENPPEDDAPAVSETLTDGLLVRDRDDDGVYLYCSEAAEVVV
ncbi:hypothetical protein EFA46_005065 [Halarchaeum sp. CBA1220]|uniref:hypothetical protein n=1 Tax=Halarchaeum sp. CBA1220 TaxID=1853682 RepID=UPI001314B47C|nr:hypothetical protein [Halarchaeum sp. CBA1220]QLC33595.1 hypothetical protein EFA46_005065 [Halarchaeum sp. CBA1220]